MKTRHLLIPFALGLGLTLTLLWGLAGRSAPVAAAPALDADGTIIIERPRSEGRKSSNAPTADLHVCLSGCPYSSVQDAVDAANDGDVIKVATGIYTGVQERPAPAGYNGPGIIAQVVYISKSVTIRGGYTVTFTGQPDPVANPTTLDAEGQGRVLFIAGEISSTIEGLHIIGGDASGICGLPLCGGGCGGGMYVVTATVTVSDNWVLSSTSDLGGGFFLYRGDATLTGNTIRANAANGRAH